jgi:hypothetical protein
VDGGIFHDFHHAWISTIKRALNDGLLPPDYYALVTALPAAYHHARTESDLYAVKANAVVIHHTSDHRIIAVVEIVSPGNKNNRHGLRAFIDKAVEFLHAGIHLLVVDIFSPGPRDPQGIHEALWDEFADLTFALPSGQPLTQAAYIGGPSPEAFVEPAAVGSTLAKMPLFLTPDAYVSVPLEATYQSAWEAVPTYWRNVLQRPAVG